MGKSLFSRYKEGDIQEVPVPETPQAIGATHLATVQLIDELLGLSAGSSQTLQPMQRLLTRLKPLMLRELATIPEAELQMMLSRIGERIAVAGRQQTPTVPALPVAAERETDGDASPVGKTVTPQS